MINFFGLIQTNLRNQATEVKKQPLIIKLEDLIFHKRLGAGQFGAVYMVKVKHNNQLYALKCVFKEIVMDQCLEKHLVVKYNISKSL